MKRIIAIFILLICGTTAFSQSRTISGKVSDSKGEPVIGAVVMLEGNKNVGTTTDADGKYTLRLPDVKSPSLHVTCISYQDQTVPVGGKSTVDIVLKDDNELLDEVVVVGYGAMRRSDLTGSVSSVKIDEDNAAKSTTLDQMLEGRAAGMQVITNSGSPDSGVSIRIRGLSTFTGNSDPLYVVDGIIVNGEAESVSTITTGNDGNVSDQTNGLAGINPQDIANIEVLKDASATAIYGSMGANGVVLITTKQANKDKPQIRFNAGVTLSQRANRIDVLDFYGFADYLEKLGTSTAIDMLSKMFENPATRTGVKVTPVDWQDYMTRLAVSQRYYISVSGRPRGYNYMMSIGYNHNQGILKKTDSDNLTLRLNLEKNILPDLTVGMKAGFGYTMSNLVSGATAGGTLSGAGSILRSMVVTRPFLYGSIDDLETDPDDDNMTFGPNRWLNESKNISKRYRINPSLFVQWKILPWLTFKSTFGGDFQSQVRIKTRSSKLSTTYGNMAGIGKGTNLRYNWDNLLMFNKKFGKHNISGTLGQSLSRNMSASENVQGYQLPHQYAEEMGINFATPEYSSFSYGESSSSLLSFFARAIYSYNNRYVLTFTYRFDGSSRFQGANKWSQFPSFAFAWRITEEPWFRVPVISNAKLRIGWGLVGNQAISNYQTQTTFSTSSIGDHYANSGASTSVVPSNIANPNLRWETSEQWNIGLDLSLWKGRLALTFDAYNKDTKDLLQTKNVALSTGFSTIAMNDGSIRNRGLEFSIDAVPLKIGGFEWGIEGNFAVNRNTILNVGESGNSGSIYLSRYDKKPTNVNYFSGSALQNSGNISPLNIFIEGQSIGQFYGYVAEGIIQEGETGPGFTEGETRGPGYIRYSDLNGNGWIDEGDQTIIGNPLPDFTYGFNTSLSWRGLTLKATFTGVHGNDIFNLNNVQEYDVYMTSRNVSATAVRNAWTPENKSNRWPGIGKISGTNDGRFSTRTVEDGSYLKFSDISLSYALPINKKKSKVFKGVNFTLSCGNVYIWTKYSGWSPTNNSFGNNVKRMGVDLSTSPVPRTYNFDVKFTF